MRNKGSVLRRCSVFTDASTATIRQLGQAASSRTVARRAPLWSSHRHPVVVRSGVLRATGMLDGKPVTFGFFGRGDLLGTETLHGTPPSMSVEAYEDCVVLDFGTQTLLDCMTVDPTLWQGLARWEHSWRVRLQEQFALLAHGSAERRVAALLMSLGKRFGVRDSRGTIINLRLTHRELSEAIGATRETVSLTVTRFRKAQMVEVDSKRFVLLDRRALRRVAEGG